ncbi:MAG: sigma-70 family RNA polymerase sigma factor [Verrucomicrobiota bacterium]|nr:sigma-70 family RNA polymerase sigma factor [Verrucomicrobiota bacterium]
MDPASGVEMSNREPRYFCAPESLATRQSLLSRIKDHQDHEGWEEFYNLYGKLIHSLALRAGLSPEEADDVLQETLLSVAREIPGFRYDPKKGSFKGWLFQITRRRIADHWRAKARRQKGRTDLENLEQQPETGPADPLLNLWEEEWRQNQMQHAVEKVKQKVAPRQWQMFDLVTLQEWPTEKVSQLLGVNRAQIYMAKMRVGRLLKQELLHLTSDGPLPSFKGNSKS